MRLNSSVFSLEIFIFPNYSLPRWLVAFKPNLCTALRKKLFIYKRRRGKNFQVFLIFKKEKIHRHLRDISCVQIFLESILITFKSFCLPTTGCLEL